MLIAGLVPVGFLAFSMQYGMMNQLREKEQYNLEKMLEQSVSSIENQSQIYKNLVDYLSYSQNLRNIFDVDRSLQRLSLNSVFSCIIDVEPPLPVRGRGGFFLIQTMYVSPAAVLNLARLSCVQSAQLPQLR